MVPITHKFCTTWSYIYNDKIEEVCEFFIIYIYMHKFQEGTHLDVENNSNKIQ